jgi:hypothetical protein
MKCALMMTGLSGGAGGDAGGSAGGDASANSCATETAQFVRLLNQIHCLIICIG